MFDSAWRKTRRVMVFTSAFLLLWSWTIFGKAFSFPVVQGHCVYCFHFKSYLISAFFHGLFLLFSLYVSISTYKLSPPTKDSRGGGKNGKSLNNFLQCLAKPGLIIVLIFSFSFKALLCVSASSKIFRRSQRSRAFLACFLFPAYLSLQPLLCVT